MFPSRCTTSSTRSGLSSSLNLLRSTQASTSKVRLPAVSVSRATTRQNLESSRTRSRNRQFSSTSCSQIHSVPTLPNAIKNGCKPLFSSTAVNLIGQNWQGGLLRRLNEEVKGTEFENASLVETIIGTAQDKTMIQAFNWASLALNNGFFLSSLKPNKNVEAGPPLPPTTASPTKTSLSSKLSETFDSLTTFKSTFSSCAMSMTSSGWVWLVRDGNGNLGILPTFGAGTVLVQNRRQMATDSSILGFKSPESESESGESGDQDSSLEINPSPRDRFPSTATVFNQRGASSSSTSANRNSSFKDGEELYPLLCLSVMEHAWLPDYGMWGKEKYLINFWDCVDWNVLQKRWEEYQP